MANKKELEEFILYRDELEKSRREKSTDAFFNDSAIHEEFVMKELFANAVESYPQISTIYMYCGKMSAFRDDMKKIVDDKKNELKPGDDAEQEEKDKWESFNPYAKMIEMMETFFRTGGRMEVIVDDDNISSIVDETIWRDTLSHYFIQKKQLEINKLTMDSGVEHFIVCGNAYRSELSHKDKTALCCFNDPEYSNLLYSNFIFLKKASRPALVC